jgi:hypothetical protein
MDPIVSSTVRQKLCQLSLASVAARRAEGTRLLCRGPGSPSPSCSLRSQFTPKSAPADWPSGPSRKPREYLARPKNGPLGTAAGAALRVNAGVASRGARAPRERASAALLGEAEPNSRRKFLAELAGRSTSAVLSRYLARLSPDGTSGVPS